MSNEKQPLPLCFFPADMRIVSVDFLRMKEASLSPLSLPFTYDPRGKM
jgi:hypothetical protein